MDETLCETCGTRKATRAVTRTIDGGSRAIYLCEPCAQKAAEPCAQKAAEPVPHLEQPCDRCRQAEGRIKFIRLVDGKKRVSFVCGACATKR